MYHPTTQTKKRPFRAGYMPLISTPDAGGYKPSLEEQIGEFPTITTQGRDIAIADAREDAQDNAEYLDWWLREGQYGWGFPQFPLGSRPVLPNDNEGTEVLGVGEPSEGSPTLVATFPDGQDDSWQGPIQYPVQSQVLISQAPIVHVRENDLKPVRPDETGYNIGRILVDVVGPPIMPPPPVLCCPLD